RRKRFSPPRLSEQMLPVEKPLLREGHFGEHGARQRRLEEAARAQERVVQDGGEIGDALTPGTDKDPRIHSPGPTHRPYGNVDRVPARIRVSGEHRLPL